MAEKFTFYASMADALSELPSAQRLAVYDAMGSYAFEGVSPTFEDIAPKVAWKLIQPLIDKSVSFQESGRKGGRPKKETSDRSTLKRGVKAPLKADSDSDSEREVKTLSGFNPLSAHGASGGTEPATPCADVAGIFEQVDLEYDALAAKAAEQRTAFDRLVSEAVPCPDHLRDPFKAVG